MHRVFLIGTILLLAAIYLIFGYWSYPVFEGDSIYFGPTAINTMHGKPLINEINAIGHAIDPGQHRLIFYPPLYPLLLAAISPTATPRGLDLALAGIDIVTLILTSLLLVRIVNSSEQISKWRLSVATALALCGLSTTLLANDFRPETPLRPIVLLIAVLMYFMRARADSLPFAIVLGIFLGSIGSMHITAAALVAGLIALYIFYSVPWKRGLLNLGVIGLTAAISFALIVSLTPYGLPTTLNGIADHFTLIYKKGLSWSFLYYHFFAPNTTFYGLLAILSVVLLGLYSFIHRSSIKSPLFFTSFFIAFLVIAFGAVAPRHLSYIYIFAPLMFIAVATAAIKSRYKALRVLSWTTLTLTCIGFIRLLYLFPLYATEGISLDEARESFLRLTKSSHVSDLFLVTQRMWPLTENYSLIEEPREDLSNANRLLIRQQFSTGETKAPQVANGSCTLVEENYARGKVALWRLPIANTIPGYGYAVYRCKK